MDAVFDCSFLESIADSRVNIETSVESNLKEGNEAEEVSALNRNQDNDSERIWYLRFSYLKYDILPIFRETYIFYDYGLRIMMDLYFF